MTSKEIIAEFCWLYDEIVKYHNDIDRLKTYQIFLAELSLYIDEPEIIKKLDGLARMIIRDEDDAYVFTEKVREVKRLIA